LSAYLANKCGWFAVAVTVFVYHPGIYPDHSGTLSLVIPSWVGA